MRNQEDPDRRNHVEKLVSVRRARLVALARRILRNRAEAEDAVQEALFLAIRSVEEFEKRPSIGVWLHALVIHTALRRVIVLRDFKGPSTSETAKRLGVTSSTARVQLSRARNSLRTMLITSPGAA